MSSHLQSRLGIKGVKSGLLHECLSKQDFADPARLAAALKHLPVMLRRARPIDEAISSAGGVRFDAIDPASAMLRALPGVFVAGEMVDWEAPTGGYLLTACFASARAAANGALDWLATLAEMTSPEPVRLTLRWLGLAVDRHVAAAAQADGCRLAGLRRSRCRSPSARC